MKKLMMAAAIVCAAAGLQAASVNWQAGVCDPDGESAVSAGQVALLAWSETAGALASSLDSAAVGGKTDSGYEVVASYTLTGDDVDAYAFKAPSFVRADAAGGVNGFYQMLLLDTTGNKFAVADLGQVSGVTDSTGTGLIDYNYTWDSTEFLGDSGYVGTIAGAPEPTSGLLLLIGVAGLALRRRRA